MPYSVRCKACSAVFAIPDEIWDRRVRGRMATLKCRSCRGDIQVDGTKETAGLLSSAAPPPPSTSTPEPIAPAAPATPSIETLSATEQEPVEAIATTPSTIEPAPSEAQRSLKALEGSKPVVSSDAKLAPQQKLESPPPSAPGTSKPIGRSSSEIVSEDSGWSLAPPPVTMAEPIKTAPLEDTKGETTPIVPVADQLQRVATPAAVTTPKVPPTIAATANSTDKLTKPATTATTATRISPIHADKSLKGAAPTGSARVTPTQTVATKTAPQTSADRPRVKAASSPGLTKTPTATTTPSPASRISQSDAEPAAPHRATAATVNVSPEDLWVVSYGEDDDRELTTPQIADELASGRVSAMTIVWRENMPEWLPISGVPELARYLHAPKTASKSRGYASPSKTSSQAGKPPVQKAEALSPTRSDATTTGSSAQTKGTVRRSLGSTPKVASLGGVSSLSRATAQPEQPGAITRERETTEVQANEPSRTQAGAKAPPPLNRQAQKSSPTIAEDKTKTEPVAQTEPVSLAPDEPASQDAAELEASVPWRRAQESLSEVLTSAPSIEEVSAPTHSNPSLPSNAASGEGESTPKSQTPAEPRFPSPTSRPDTNGKTPANLPSRGSSFRPPKPLETATSLVVHTAAAPAGEVLAITDEEFLRMQRRFPKWGLPAALAVGLGVAGLVAYLAMNREAPPPLPVAPIVPPASSGKVTRTPQPDLSDIHPPSAVASVGDQDFAKAFAQAANKGLLAFDGKGAERVLAPAIERASRCRAAAEPAGQVAAIVVIAPTGQVTSVQVGAPYTNTPTGKCIDKALRGFATKPFQGSPEKLSLSVPLR